MTARCKAVTGFFHRWSARQNRRILNTLAAMAILPMISPMVGPTPGARPMNGATNGRSTYVRRQRTPEIKIDRLNPCWACSPAATGVSV